MRHSQRKLIAPARFGLILIASLLFALMGVQPAFATGQCYVNINVSGGANDGSSWTNAYVSLQSALANNNCAEIWTAQGTYRPHLSDRAVSFVLKSGVAIYGGFAGTETLLSQRDPSVNITILSGDIGTLNDNSDNSYHVVTCSGIDTTAVLDGFTVTAGNANGGSYPNYYGGGMFNENGGNPTLANIIFSDNSANNWGGGMYNANSSPTLTNVAFSSNTATSSGGGMANYNSNPILTNVAFSSNSTDNIGGGMLNYWYSNPTLTNVTFNGNFAGLSGGGMFNNASSPTLTNVVFNGNSGGSGGGISNNESSAPTLANVTFSANFVTGVGGGMENNSSDPTLSNVTFNGNSADMYGGGVYNWSSNPTFTNVTFSGNSADIYGGGMYNYNSSPSLTNVIAANHSAAGGNCYNNSSSLNAISANNLIDDTSCGLTDGVNGNKIGAGYDAKLGLLQNNGGFTQTMALLVGSAAIDAGKDSACPAKDQRGAVRPQGARCDIGAYEFKKGAITYRSTGVQDGWILESTETSNKGGSFNATAATFNLGDDAAKKQYRAILSFNTASLPDTAVVTKVTLKIKQSGAPVGTNPFATLGKLLVDIRRPYFGPAVGLAASDFQAAASKSNIGFIPNAPVSGWYSKVWSTDTFFSFINRTGTTQFRLRFQKDDNNNAVADYMKFFSGNAAVGNRPQLIVEYYVP